jgi:flagellar assembly protein FliH
MSGFDPIGLSDFRIVAAAEGAGSAPRATPRVLFEEDFAAPRISRRKPEPPPEPEPPPPTYSEAELEDARRAAFREGKDAGRTAARAEAEAAGQAALSAIAAELAAARRAAHAAAAEAAETAARLVLGTLAALHPSLSEKLAAADIATMVASLLPQLGGEPRLALRLCPPLVVKLESTVRELADAAGFQGEIIVRPDPAIAPDAATLSWSAGAALRNPSALRQALLESLAALNLAPLMPPLSTPEIDHVERAA